MSRAAVTNPVSWLFVGVALLLILVLAYYLTLTTRPEISELSPLPNSVEPPGPVHIGAVVTSQRSLEAINLFLDGELIEPAIEHVDDQQWSVSYEDVFDRGERRVLLQVIDSSGRVTEHDWAFEATGDLNPPRVSLESPPSRAVLPAGTGGLWIQSTTFAGIGSVSIALDGAEIEYDIEESDSPRGEYSANDDMPIHEWTITAEVVLENGLNQLVVTVVDEYGAGSRATWMIEASTNESDVTARYFTETGHYAVEPFLSFWSEFGGNSVFGPPVSPPMQIDSGNAQQFYRYARFELDDEEQVQLMLIGREIFGDPEPPPAQPPSQASRLFDTTGHYIHGPIREYWEENGGLQIFGYPISREFETESGYAQYFERALIEVVESGSRQTVRKAPLGEQLYDTLQRRGGSGTS
jgi:hypothetical protein